MEGQLPAWRPGLTQPCCPPPRPPAAFGLPTTVLAAVLAAQPQGISLLDQRFMLVGAARG